MNTYKTLKIATSEILLKEKNSKFFGYGFPITSTEDVKLILDNLRKKYLKAGHFCYAYQIGTDKLYSGLMMMANRKILQEYQFMDKYYLSGLKIF